MALDDIHYQPLTTVAELIRTRNISPVELTQAILARIEQHDGALKSYTTVTADLALSQAKAAETDIGRGLYRGPMHGIPIAVKDLCFTKGIRTTGGMTMYADFKPDHDATVVTKLAQAGAVLLGKLHMTEGATLEHHPDLPEPVNPWKSDLWTGVSSSGSGLATAAGLTYASIGSDTGGSIRFPSACNALTGVKPSWGLISRYGIFDMAATFDHLGPMTRSAADAAAMLQTLAGWDASDTTSLPWPAPNYLDGLDGVYGARDMRIGLDPEFTETDTDPVTAGFIRDAVSVLANLGATPVQVRFPSAEGILAHAMTLIMVEMAAAHAETYPLNTAKYGKWITRNMEIGRNANSVTLGEGIIERQKFRGAIVKMFSDIDAFVMPVFWKGAPTWAEMREIAAGDFNIIGNFSTPFNAAGVPTITLPCGYSDDGRPVAFQLAGAHGSEQTLLRIAHAYQQVTDWHRGALPGCEAGACPICGAVSIENRTSRL
jgi:amidase